MGQPMSDRRCTLAAAVSAVVVAGAAFGDGGCGSPEPVVFPKKASPVVLPIRDPILRPDLVVQATVHGRDDRHATLWMLLDSGATVGSLPEEVARGLGIPEARRVRMLAITGATRTTLVTAPRLTLGALVVSRIEFLVNTMAGPAAELGMVGQSILARVPWEISWDRGTVTLGATPWSEEEAEVTSVPLHPFASGVESVVARVNGRPLTMMLDTGAFVSAIPEGTARELGLEVESLSGRTFAGASGPFKPDHVFAADIQLGSLTLHRQRFMSSLSKGLAVLGRDILGQLEIQIVPGQRLLLRPRGDLRATAAARVHRWAWMRPCASLGCIRARIAAPTPDTTDERPAGAAAATPPVPRVELEIEAPLPGPLEILFGCADRGTEPDVVVTAGQRAVDALPPLTPLPDGPGPPPLQHLVVVVKSPAPGPLEVALPDADRLRASPAGSPCRDLAVLDVAPSSRGAKASEGVRAYLVR